MALDVGALVDQEQWLLNRRVFWDEEIYQLELERIFARCWLVLGHESQISKPGDFVSTNMGEDPVLVARQKDGSIRAFINTCRHRGMRVCRLDSGNVPGFTCSYHGWTYDISGQLVSVPQLEEGYRGEFDLSEWGLQPVPHVESYKGLIFGTLDSDAPPLLDYLGDMTFFLDGLLDREGGTELLGGVHKWVIPCNWKIAAENFISDQAHGEPTHGSAIVALLPDDFDPASFGLGAQMQWYVGNGHGLLSLSEPGPGPVILGDELAAYWQTVRRPDIERRVDPELGVVFNGSAATVFPELLVHHRPEHHSSLAPQGPEQDGGLGVGDRR